MQTVVISGRVDATVKDKASIYIKRAGQTAADVVKTVWENIAATGEVPTAANSSDDAEASWNSFMSLRNELSELTPSFDLATLTDEQVKDMVVSRYV